MRSKEGLLSFCIVIGLGMTAIAGQSTDEYRVEAKLKAHKDLREVKVKCERVVILSGNVPTEADRQQAERSAKASGATKVDNQIAIVADSAKPDRPSGTSGGHPEASSIGDEVSNAWITTKLKEQYMTVGEFKDSAIHVDTDGKGDVTLTGTVSSASVHVKALQIARKTKGVEHIKDGLKIAYGAP